MYRLKNNKAHEYTPNLIYCISAINMTLLIIAITELDCFSMHITLVCFFNNPSNSLRLNLEILKQKSYHKYSFDNIVFLNDVLQVIVFLK